MHTIKGHLIDFTSQDQFGRHGEHYTVLLLCNVFSDLKQSVKILSKVKYEL